MDYNKNKEKVYGNIYHKRKRVMITDIITPKKQF